jgi:hypothetical protein
VSHFLFTCTVVLIGFTDEFRKVKRSKWCGIEAVYIAIGNFPLESRYRHKNMFVFMIGDEIEFFDLMQLLKDSILEFNRRESLYYCSVTRRFYRLYCLLTLIACDNLRAMQLLNLSTRTPNYYCRHCMAHRTFYEHVAVPWTYLEHNGLMQKAITGNEQEKDQIRQATGIKLLHSVDLEQFNFFQQFQDIPFDILHTVYLGLVKHALRDTCERLSVQQKEDFQVFYEDLNRCGFYYLPRGQVLKYLGSQTGKDFKAISKVVIHLLRCVHCDPEVLTTWCQ